MLFIFSDNFKIWVPSSVEGQHKDFQYFFRVLQVYVVYLWISEIRYFVALYVFLKIFEFWIPEWGVGPLTKLLSILLALYGYFHSGKNSKVFRIFILTLLKILIQESMKNEKFLLNENFRTCLWNFLIIIFGIRGKFYRRMNEVLEIFLEFKLLNILIIEPLKKRVKGPSFSDLTKNFWVKNFHRIQFSNEVL